MIRPRHLLLALAAAASGLATAVALVAASQSPPVLPRSLHLLLMGIGMAWVGLAAVYLPFGRQPLWLRLAICTTVALGGGAIGAIADGQLSGEHAYATWCGVMLFGAFVIATPLIYLWARGLRLTHAEHPPIEYWKPRRQFSLWTLLLTTTCTAVLLAIAVRLEFPINELYTVLVIVGSTAIVAYVTTGTILSRISLLWGVVAIPAMIVLLARWLGTIERDLYISMLIVASTTAIVMTVWMLILRIAGYYLLWPDYAAEETVGPSKRLVDEHERPVEPANGPEAAQPH